VTGDRGAAAIRQAARSILSQSQFRQPPESPIDRFRHWLGQQVARALNDALSGHLGLLGGLVLLVIVAAVIWVVVRTVRATRRDPSVPGFVVMTSRRPAADWLADAARSEAAGDWRGALRYRYRALIAELSRRGLVDEVPGRTSGEYRHEVAQSLPRVADAFGDATDLFELVVYGDAPAGPDASARARSLSDRVLAGTR
jgi:Domain of unknown function (DUF4129)